MKSQHIRILQGKRGRALSARTPVMRPTRATRIPLALVPSPSTLPLLSVTLAHTHPHAHSHTPSHSLTHAFTSHTHSHNPVTHTLSHTLSLTHFLTHTHPPAHAHRRLPFPSLSFDISKLPAGTGSAVRDVL